MLISLNRARCGRPSDSGAVAILIAAGLSMLLIAAAMVLDFGLLRLDRQMNKSSSDAAASAGVRGLDRGDGQPHPFAGVCQALNYLRVSQADLAGLPDASSAAGNVTCPENGRLNTVCAPSDNTTWARYESTVGRVTVQIKSPYLVSDGGFPEESLSALSSDTGDAVQGGCDQLAVIITEAKTPGLGSLATSSDLVSRIRSVGRVTLGEEGEGAVALLLLERHDCAVLDVDGAGSKILVRGNGDVAGLMHSDSLGNGSDCSTGSSIMNGNQPGGIVAQESETGSPKLPGIIGVRALSGEVGAVPAKAADPIPDVYAGPYPPGSGPTARGLITRAPVDDRYLTAIETAVTEANVEFALTPLTAPAAGYTVVDCTPTAAERALLTPVFVNCPGNPGFNAPNVTLQSSKIMFNGKVIASQLSMPLATRVFVAGLGAVGVKADGFRMHQQSRLACGDANSGLRARLFIREGSLETNGGVLQMCNTTLIMMGGQSDACLPATSGTAPTETPCGAGAGTGTVKVGGTASQDWTAPNQRGAADTAVQADWDNFEDLAMWSETYGTGPDWQMAGGGSMYLSGVFMVPNANPFNIKGGGLQDVENSQYVARKLRVTGGGTLTLRPNPYDVITIPIVGGYGLVR